MERIPVFDGHNDLIGRMFEDPEVDFFNGTRTVHLSYDAVRAGGMTGGLFALFVPPTATDARTAGKPAWETVAASVPLERARRVTLTQMARLLQLERDSGGRLRICRTVAEIDAATAHGATAVVVHLEGADGISRSMAEFDVLYAAGLRSVGPVWSRHNRFGHGVPIRGPVSGEDDRGLTVAGRRLVRACRRRGVVVDLSHMTEAGFWDVASLDDGPLVASHSNVRALADTPRNLTNQQLRAIGSSGGLVGLNFATIFLRPDGAVDGNTPLELMIAHLRHMVEHAGIDHVALGSDFDGAVVPQAIGTAAGLPHLLEAMRTAGFAADEVSRIAHDNWRRLLSRVWGG